MLTTGVETLSDRASPDGTGAPLLEVQNLHVQFETSRGIVRAVDGISYTVKRGRNGGDRRRIRLRQVGVLARHHAAPGQEHRPHHRRPHPVRGPQPARSLRRRHARGARPRHRDDLPGADDLAQPGPADRPADHGAAVHPPEDERGARRARARSSCCGSSASPTASAGSSNIRITCPAACASA